MINPVSLLTAKSLFFFFFFFFFFCFVFKFLFIYFFFYLFIYFFIFFIYLFIYFFIFFFFFAFSDKIKVFLWLTYLKYFTKKKCRCVTNLTTLCYLFLW